MNAAEESVTSLRCLTYSQRFSNELNVLSIDHCYAKPWSSHPEASNARPLHMLFMEKFPRPSIPDKHRSTDILNVVDSIDETSHTFEATKTSLSSEKLGSLLSWDYLENKDDWEEHIASIRTTWSVVQNRIFAKVMRILQADRLARLSISGVKNEQIQRKLQIDKAAKRVRGAFANVGWDMTVILWLHNLFLENLRGQLLISYLEILQALKVKIPSLVDRLVQGTNSNVPPFNAETLTGLLKKNIDPVLSSINQQKLKKLPENPLLLMIPNAASTCTNLLAIKRYKFWHHQLSAMGKVVSLAPLNTSPNLSVVSYLENMIANARAKILELKSQFPGRPLIIIGWQVGALVAINIALMDIVHGVISLGSPTIGINGTRGEIDDSIYNLRAPTLFVVGQHASSCSVDVLEDIRERLRVETQLVLVGGADDQLRMSRAKKQSCAVTQSMVDRCIMDEMYQFLCLILSQAHTQTERMEEPEVNKKQRKRKQKEMCSSAGSQTTGQEPKQVGVKPMKALKLAKAVGYTGQLVLSGKIAKRSPKKKLHDAGEPPKHAITPSSSNESVTRLSKVSEAEAIASAPELSNLLQSMNKFDQNKSGSTSVTKPLSPQVASTIPSATALTLSKFLQSTGLLRAGTVVKSSAAVSQPKESEKVLFGNTDVEKQHEILVKQPETQMKQPEAQIRPPESQIRHSQILLRAGTSSSPFSIPLTLNMANKVLKATPMMKITGSNSNSAQIQQLLSTFSTANASVLVSSGQTTHQSTVLNTLLSSGTSTAVTHTSTSSVINMGGETVHMKETPATATASVPCTVSIDLGQMSQTPTSSYGVMRLMAPSSKISLISNIKHFPKVSEPIVPSVSQPSSLTSIYSPISNITSATQLKLQSTPSVSSVTPTSAGLQLSPSTGLLSFKVLACKESDMVKTEDKQVKQGQSLNFSTMVRLSTASHQLNVGTAQPTLSKMATSIPSSVTKTSDAKPVVAQTSVHVATSTCSTATPTHSLTQAIPSANRDTERDNPAVKMPSKQSLPCNRDTESDSQAVKMPSKQSLPCSRDTESDSPAVKMPSKQSLPCSRDTESDSRAVKMPSKQSLPCNRDTESDSQAVKMPSKQSLPSTPVHTKAAKSTIVSYTPTAKTGLSTSGSTRTRQIKTPKQYDL